MDACDFASSSLSSKVSQQTKWRIHFFFFFPIGKVNPPGKKYLTLKHLGVTRVNDSKLPSDL